MWERGQERAARSGKNFTVEHWLPLGICSSWHSNLSWRQSAPRWWLQDAHLAGTLRDPVRAPPDPPTGGWEGAELSTPPCAELEMDGEEEAEPPALLDGTPIVLASLVGGMQDAQDALPRTVVAQSRRRFLGDDHMILAAGRTWPVRLTDGTWWAFEVLSKDRLPATAGCLLREMLPVALEWRAEPAAAGTLFEPYRADGPHLSLVFSPWLVSLG